MNRREIVAGLTALLGYSFVSVSKMAASAASDEKPARISLIRLIANPNSFDRRRLTLTGYLANNGLDRALGLYVSEVDGRNFIVENSIDLKIDESRYSKLVGKYVTLTGTYHAPPETPLVYNGYLDQISNLRAWESGDKD